VLPQEARAGLDDESLSDDGSGETTRSSLSFDGGPVRDNLLNEKEEERPLATQLSDIPEVSEASYSQSMHAGSAASDHTAIPQESNV
jgi:hypothetical protein